MSVQNKVTAVTDAGRGIGQSSMLRFARAGAHVVLFSRTQHAMERREQTFETQADRPLGVRGDVACEEDVQARFQQIIAASGGIDMLVNCAGVVAVKPFAEMDTKTWDRVLNTNVRGTFLCCFEAFKIMGQPQAGVIIKISSLSDVKGVEKFPGLSTYNVSKTGVASLTEILAVEGRPQNIRVVAVSPGVVETEMLRQAAPHLKADMTPDELAEILLFLAGESGCVRSRDQPGDFAERVRRDLQNAKGRA